MYLGSAAMESPLHSRGSAVLARDLLKSLDALTEAEVEHLWLEEAERRHQEIVAGAVDTLSMEEALSTARAARR